MIAPFSVLFFIYLMNLTLNHSCTYSTYIKVLITMISLELLLVQGYFLRIGTSEISYQLFMNCILLVYSIAFLIRQHISVTYKDIFYGSMFLLASLVGVIYQELVPYDGLVMTYDSIGSWDAYTLGANNKGSVVVSWPRVLSIYVTFITAVITIFIFHAVLKKEGIQNILQSVNTVMKWNVLLVSIEFIFKNIIHSDFTLRFSALLFGEGANTYSDLIVRNGIYQLQGLTREPSHLALTLFFTMVLYVIEKHINSNDLKKIDYLYLLYVILLMIISGSFASYLYITIFVLWMIFLYVKKAKSTFYYIVSAIALWCVIFSFYVIFNGDLDTSTYLGRRLNLASEMGAAILDNSWYGMGGDSALPRFLSIYDTILDFCQRPWFGMGLSVQISHGGLANVLSDIGLVGAFFWGCLIFNKFSYHYTSIFILLIGSNILLGNVFETLGLTYFIFIISCFRKDNFYNEKVHCWFDTFAILHR